MVESVESELYSDLLSDDNSVFAYSSDDSGSFSDAYFLRVDCSPIDQHRSAFSKYSHHREPTPRNYGTLTEDAPFLHGSLMESEMKISGSTIMEGNPELNIRSAEASLKNQKNKSPPRLAQQAHLWRNTERRKLLRRKQKEQEQREQLVRQVRGKLQPNEWRDVGWLCIFLVQLLFMVYCAVRYGSQSVLKMSSAHSTPKPVHIMTNDDDLFLRSFLDDGNQLNSTLYEGYESFHIDYRTAVQLLIITGVYAGILSTLTAGFILILAKSMIQTSLVFIMVSSLAWTLLGMAMNTNGIVIVMGFVFLGFTFVYTLWIWDRIPFAATNMHTALCGIRGASDILLMGLLMLTVAFGWCIIWSMAFIGIVDTFACLEPNCPPHLCLYLALIFSFWWTNVVIKNIVSVTTAAAIGRWVFEPDEIRPCCALDVSKPLLQAMTTSLGSICYGSLAMMPGQLMSITCCCLPSTANYFKRFNRWAYIYIGMYGYRFTDAGYKARQLFETREWTSVVQENIIHNVLFITSLVIGGSTGTFGVLVEEVDGYEFTTFHQPMISAFLIGSTFGFVLANILLLGVMGSAVNTILVCFAADPFELHKNHPQLSQEMRDVWAQHVWENPV